MRPTSPSHLPLARSLAAGVLVGAISVATAAVRSNTAPASNDIPDLRSRQLDNPLAYVPPQCYTRTEEAQGKVHNPCYTCHQASQEPNYIDDADLQTAYDLTGDDGVPVNNPWTNLFQDRRAAVAGISDASILAYVRQDNYRGSDGTPQLATTLRHNLPARWDSNGNGRWDGYLPDAGFRFDAEGFDVRADGSYSGWRAFAYAPFLGTFWPTNGATDDVLIRLAPAFWQNEQGQPDMVAYKTNLAIVTAVVQRRDVPLEVAVDESQWQVDLDKDGRYGTARVVRYDWAPLQGRTMSYVGKARQELAAGRVHLAGGLFPEGSEFLHSVRYLDPDDAGGIQLAPRMRELRYAAKKSWYSYSTLREMALKEVREKSVNPERTRQFSGSAESGLGNGQGWVYQGFIEDSQGRLRPQTYEETVFCMGCHSGIGATTDSAFSFPRKFVSGNDGVTRHGWYHWSQQGLAGMPEPLRKDGQPEYAFYLASNGAGDEFRGNAEVQARFFDNQGQLRPDRLAALRSDVSVLLNPSRARALLLNKAYRVIVAEQSFTRGRDATVTPVETVHRQIVPGTPTGVVEPLTGQ